MYLTYFLIALLATIIGAISGMGGGVIMKPVMDMIGTYNVSTIGVLSSVTVFVMAIVSTLRQIRYKTKIELPRTLMLVIGSVIGGILGQDAVDLLLSIVHSSRPVTIIQNIILAILTIFTYLYMRYKDKIRKYSMKSIIGYICIGISLGIISSFLGIGGGPINVTLLILVFSIDIKSATVTSILIILFSQISKLSVVAFTTGYNVYDLSMLLVMVPGAVIGGMTGAKLNKSLPDKKVEMCFNIIQLGVLFLAIYNIIKNVVAL